MIYLVKRAHMVEYVEEEDIILATTDKEKANSICEKFKDIYPDDEIWVLEWEDGVLPYNYELELRFNEDDCD